MSKEELLEFQGTVVELLPNATFRIRLENEHEIIGHTAGKLRKNRIRVLAGPGHLSLPVKHSHEAYFGERIAAPTRASGQSRDCARHDLSS